MILLQVVPLLVLTCHCTVGAGVPVAAAVNVAVVPVFAVTLAGWLVMVGAWFTPSTATLLRADPTLFTNEARYCVPPLAVVSTPVV